ncbi:alpha/beta-hydrolase [Mycena galericulata]|nr:alpha/beta-hydrolase [Mycena galericulata]
MHLTVLLAAFSSITVVTSGSQPSVTIKNGTVQGVHLPQFGQSLFLGIPYAQPPVGDLRLRTPRSVNESFGTLDATAYGPHCWSAFTTGFDDNSGFNNSEDCLTLNVIRPDGVSETSPVPVVVWSKDFTHVPVPVMSNFFLLVHGGGLADFRYNGTWLVQASVDNGKPIVFVSINYRLSSLGFLSSRELADEGSLNLGIRDQRLALHWVQENIAKFGGDPNDNSRAKAGSSSAHIQIIAYGGRDDKLFNQAIGQSGTGGNFSLPDLAPYQDSYDTLIASTTCSSTANSSAAAQLSCLRSLPIDVFRQNSVINAEVVFDGDLIDVSGMAEAYRTGKWVKVAFIVSRSNTDEGRSFAPLGANTTAEASDSLSLLDVPVDLRDSSTLIFLRWGAHSTRGTSNTPGSQNKRVAAITGDVVMAARVLLQLDLIFDLSVPQRFNHKPWSISFGTEDFIGDFTEVGYVFNTQNNDTDFWITNHFTATYLGPTAPIEDRFLGVYMSRTWASFIATGDPNNANVTSKIIWPKYSDGQENMVWQTQGSTIEKDNYREAGMQFIMENLYDLF